MKTLLALMAFAMLPLAAPAADGCAGQSHCEATRSFAASVTNFRVSKSGRYRVLTVTVNFRNLTTRPLTLGYVGDSGLAMDEQGNRYVVANPQAVRGIGMISGGNFDPKFTLQPGEAADTRFELVWEPGRSIVGVSYDLDLAIREINAVNADQFRLGVEHALHFAKLAEGAGSAVVRTAGAATQAAGVPAAAPMPVADPCGGAARCYNAGAFVAEVQQLTSTAMTPGARNQSIAINVRFRNVSGRPIILAYKSGSSSGIDNFGNQFYWGRPGSHDTSVKGMGHVSGRSADTQFALAPGQSRNATFNLIRYSAHPPIGSAWGFDVVIDELEILPGQQVRTVRENSVNFRNLTAGGPSGVAAGLGVVTGLDAAGGGANVTSSAAQAQDVATEVIDLFRKLKRH
ncbi:MAG: hypothetical protein CMLOHMNK_01480 [Steroidobacteraceae bacterium]|nr:hypothetical protein [Steroidobacteraceae bacterium]